MGCCQDNARGDTLAPGGQPGDKGWEGGQDSRVPAPR